MEQRQRPLEMLVTPNSAHEFWNAKRVLLTGHTGFKGSWLALWLHHLGARVTGLALPPPTTPSMFEVADVAKAVRDERGDIRNAAQVCSLMQEVRPEIVIHMAAQPLVRESYVDPLGTYASNVMGTAHILDAVRHTGAVRSVLCITTDKVYENREWEWGYREIDPLGGQDPYSNSKACSELVVSAYRSSFFPPRDYQAHGVALATARAGNVIGGGDWAKDRLLPDLIRAFLAGQAPRIRSPKAVRPWQHVLEPLWGYLLLAEKLYTTGAAMAEGWNFGPKPDDARPVDWICETFCEIWGDGASWELDGDAHPHEAGYLYLDTAKANRRLGYTPRWGLHRALEETASWFRAHAAGAPMGHESLAQIERFMVDGEDN